MFYNEYLILVHNFDVLAYYYFFFWGNRTNDCRTWPTRDRNKNKQITWYVFRWALLIVYLYMYLRGWIGSRNSTRLVDGHTIVFRRTGAAVYADNKGAHQTDRLATAPRGRKYCRSDEKRLSVRIRTPI